MTTQTSVRSGHGARHVQLAQRARLPASGVGLALPVPPHQLPHQGHHLRPSEHEQPGVPQSRHQTFHGQNCTGDISESEETILICFLFSFFTLVVVVVVLVLLLVLLVLLLLLLLIYIHENVESRNHCMSIKQAKLIVNTHKHN